MKFRDDLAEVHDCVGRWYHSRHLIELQTPDEHHSRSYIMQTFWHEVTHAMLDVMGYPALSADEELVDRIGQAIHQVLKTKRSK